MSPDDVSIELRKRATGIPTEEAGIDLLAQSVHGALLSGPWIRTDEHGPYFDTSRVDESGWLSGGEQRLLQIAASLVDLDRTVPLAEVLTGLDEWHTKLVLNAMTHATGWSEVSKP
ncbi:hypothetical protein [Georgenia sp. Z1491]|uniref:hypothetical protein n=1 Tax=Georgenia sp. Z1491 TaxID=3416707 RepID=UPI003CF4C0D4